MISIHALLAESDHSGGPWQAECRISIHALLAESDVVSCGWCGVTILFLSTLSLRRATRRSSKTARHFRYFYPRSPCGERRYPRFASSTNRRISIHALLAESDQTTTNTSTTEAISIHALLAESDLIFAARQAAIGVFLSTLSLRRATPFSRSGRMTRPYFYPRSPCGERHVACGDRNKLCDFYPRSPCGERHVACGDRNKL